MPNGAHDENNNHHLTRKGKFLGWLENYVLTILFVLSVLMNKLYCYVAYIYAVTCIYCSQISPANEVLGDFPIKWSLTN